MTTGLSPIAGAVDRHRLADIAARTGIHLTTTSGTLTVRCPMPAHGHPDRTPSMRLYLDDNRYYCFGCGSRGDVVQWVRDSEGVSVSEALALLDSNAAIRNAWAGAAGVGPGRPSRRVAPSDGPDPARTPTERVLAAMEAAWAACSGGEHHRAGMAYLLRRGIDVGVVEYATGRREVGHSLDGGRSLLAVLHAEGFTDDELIDAGLARRSFHADRLVDVYRRRVLVPIRTPEGRVCALIGRNVGDSHAPKYLNPPRTAVYDKSLDLYAPLPAPPQRHGTAVVVEGTLDALAVAVTAVRAGLAGRFWPVTQSGRELSSGQVEKILAVTEQPPLLALDADTAGQEATARLCRAFAVHHVTAVRARLPEDQDPASWLASAGGRSQRAARAALVVLTGGLPPRLRGAGRLSRSADLAPATAAEVGL